jgi:hypothetical protein
LFYGEIYCLEEGAHKKEGAHPSRNRRTCPFLDMIVSWWRRNTRSILCEVILHWAKEELRCFSSVDRETMREGALS